MQFHPGEIVLATAGRDKGKYFIVLSCAEGFVYLCDGKNRRLDNQKRKSVRHISESIGKAEGISFADATGNKAIRKIISGFKSAHSDRKE